MLRRYFGRGIGTIAIALVLSAPAARAETLTDALISAYRHSGLLEQNRALVRAADENVAQAVATLRPVLNYLAASNYVDPVAPGGENWDFSLRLSADLLLYDFGGSRYAIDAAKEAVMAAREALRGAEQTALFRALTAYMQVRLQQSFVELSQNNLRVISQELRAANDRFEVGEVTRTDVSLAEARVAASRSGLASAVGALARAREEYRAAVGHYPENLAPPPPAPRLPGSLEQSLQMARQQHPSVNEAQRQVAVAEFNILRAEAAMKPSLSLNARVAFDEDFDDQRSVGIQLGGPIYQGGRLSSLFRQAQSRRDAARAALYTVVFQAEQQVGQAWSDLTVTRASIEANRGQVEAATVALRGTQEEAKLGARTTLDVLDTEQDLLDARVSLVSSQIDQYVAVYALLRAMGMLTVDDLNLGIATYDASAHYEAVRQAPMREVSPQGERLDRILRRLGNR